MTNKATNSGFSEDVLDQAADWFDRQSDMSADERSHFESWLAASPEHARAYGMMRHTMLDVALQDAVEESSSETTLAVEPVSTFAYLEAALKGWLDKSRAFCKARPAWATAAIAATMIIAATPVLFFAETPPNTDFEPQIFATQIRERSNFTLSDATRVYLDADSRVAARLSQTSRTVTLSKGEAVFDVAADTTRPFDVLAGNVTVTVTGTRFSVSKVDRAIDIQVFEGSVQVTHGRSAQLLLNGGDRATIDWLGAVERASLANGAFETWRSGWLETDSMALSHVVARLNRYTEKEISIENEGLAQTKITGRFQPIDTDQTLAQLSALLDLEIETGEDRILLSRRAR